MTKHPATRPFKSEASIVKQLAEQLPCESEYKDKTNPTISDENAGIDFWQSWAENRDYLRRLSYRWMNIGHMDAEDALSDASLRAYTKYKIHAAKINNERAWLARLLHNICIDNHRSNKRRFDLAERVKEVEDIQESTVVTVEPSPEQALMNSELGSHIKEAIDQLPEKIRIPIIMRLVRGDEYADIANHLDISNDNVRKRVQQGRFILRQKLSQFR